MSEHRGLFYANVYCVWSMNIHIQDFVRTNNNHLANAGNMDQLLASLNVNKIIYWSVLPW